MDLHTKKYRKKKEEKKSRAKNFGLSKKKNCMFLLKIKKTNSSTVLPILFESRKEGWQFIKV
jgi:hypothetical protein